MSALYETLYRDLNYHNDTRLTHAKGLIRLLQNNYSSLVSTVLDVGCSHGRGVELLWESGFRASGIDISQTAIARARELRTHPQHCPSGACFRVGSAAAIPFANKEFDAIMSTDVLEHLLPHEVDAMVDEFTRVARRLLLLAISNKPTCGGCTAYLEALHRNGSHKNVHRIHSTTMSKSEWIARLTRDGRLALEADLPPATMGHSKNYLDFVLRVVNRTAPASEPEWTGIIGW